MTEKFFLQWNDFKENVLSAFGRLRADKDFADVTLACEDGEKIEAHRGICLQNVRKGRPSWKYKKSY